MTLDETTAIKTIKSPRSAKKIEAVKDQESQLRVMTESMSQSELTGERYWTNLMATMEKRSDKKFGRVKEFIRYPLPVGELSDSILDDFYRVFDGKNRYFNTTGDRDITRLEEWIREETPEEWIEKQARQVFKNKPNSFVVIDQTEDGSPYMIFVDSTRLIDAVFKSKEGDLEYITFIHSQEPMEDPTVILTYYSVYDSENYYVFSKQSNQDEYTKVSARSHGIGYCPAKSFIKTPSNSKNNFKRSVAFTNSLSKLEDWTMFDVFRNYVDYYAPFPVTEAPKNKCPNPECQDGKVSEEILDGNQAGATRTRWTTCKACDGVDGGQHIFPGTHIGIRVQRDKDVNDGSGVFKMIFPDTAQMKYVPEKLQDLELDIRHKTVGINTLMANEAFNELQVKGSFATMESILLRTKTELDELYKWIVNTIGRLYYTDLDANVEANFGTEFYLVSEEDLQKRYKEAKATGLPMDELLMIYIQLIETKYKGNTNKINHQKMLLQLDPYPLFSTKEMFEMKDKGIIDDVDLSLKVNFLNFISKFENENVPITQFGLNLELYQRIDKIRETLNIYNNETIKSKQLRPSVEGSEKT